MPFVEKSAYRYMQFDPENYPIKDFKFQASSSLGIIAREYEVSQLIQLMQTVSPDSPVYVPLLNSIVDNMNLANREELMSVLEQAAEPDPKQVQMQEQMEQQQLQFQAAQSNLLNSQAEDAKAGAQKKATETALMPQELEISRIKAVTANIQKGDGDDKEFEKRLKISDAMLRERTVKAKEDQVRQMAQQQQGNQQAAQALQQRMQRGGPQRPPGPPAPGPMTNG